MATPTDDDNADDCISGNYYGYERGGTLEHNNSQIPRNELKELLRFINENKNMVIVEWAMRFGRTDFKEN